MAVRIFTGSTAPSLTDTIRSGGSAVDLTGATVEFQMRPVGAATLTVDAAAVVVTPAAGAVRYDWAGGDLGAPGDYLAWWVVTLAGGGVLHSPEFLVEVLAHTPAVAPLCTVAEVKRDPAMAAAGTVHDDEITALVLAVTQDFLRDTGRELVVQSGVNPQTRPVDVGGYWRDRVVAVGDMQGPPTAVTILAEDGSTVQALTVATDVQAYPLTRGPWEPVTHLRFRSSAGVLRPEYQLSVTGSFGFPMVPDDIRDAVVETVRFRHRQRRALTAPSPDQFEDPQGPQRLYPLAALQVIQRYRLPGVA